MIRLIPPAGAALLAALAPMVPGAAQTMQERAQAAQGQNAQSGVPGARSGTAPSSTLDRAVATSTPEFIRQASMSDSFELASSQLAAARSQSAQVREFAQRMLREHRETAEDLRQLAAGLPGQAGASAAPRGTGPTARPGPSGSSAAGTTSSMAPAESGRGPAASAASAAGLDQQRTALMQQLERAEGAEFDRLYILQQVQAHQQAVEMFRSYAREGDNAELKEWAAATLPSLEQHLREAQQLRTGG